MVLSPSATLSAVGLIALAVWFPVTILTASGISNTRASYFDVARTLGAGRAYLIFHVAIPAAMPSIFIGLFMGLGTSFLTLVVAETVGVKSGLGWYVSWAQGWAEYGKVYAALIIMAAFFSTIMTLLSSKCATASWSGRKASSNGNRFPEASNCRRFTRSKRAMLTARVFRHRIHASGRTVALAGVSLSVASGEFCFHRWPEWLWKINLAAPLCGT